MKSCFILLPLCAYGKKLWYLNFMLLRRDVWFAYYLLLGGLLLLMSGTQWCETVLGIALIIITMRNLWYFFGYRNREIKQMKAEMKNGNSLSFLYHDINELEHSNQVNLPRVTVVMPLKGFGEHNLHNWRSQVRTYRTHATGTHSRFRFWFICDAILVRLWKMCYRLKV